MSINQQLWTGEADDPDAARLVGFPVPAHVPETATAADLDAILTEFIDKVRQGEAPDVEAYVRRYPSLAADLRELLPFAGTLEEWRVNKEVECVKHNVPEQFDLDQIGEYRVVREIGRGGMGIVFEALHPPTQRKAAIKLLPLRYVTDLPRRRSLFQQEAATIARLRHQNIVPVYSFGEHEGYCYYVMQLVDGVNLEWVIDRLRRDATPVNAAELRRVGRGDDVTIDAGSAIEPQGLGRESWRSFAKIGVQVCQALAHAHQMQVLHNDIKPANLMLDCSGRVVVTDFGVGARWEEELAESDQRAVGTARYMAPERFGGMADVRSDVYSLGITLYELLSRTPAFTATDRHELIQQVLAAAAKPLREACPAAPKPLLAIITKAMRRQPEERYPSATAFRADLLRYLHGQKVEARLPRKPLVPFRWFPPGSNGSRPFEPPR